MVTFNATFNKNSDDTFKADFGEVQKVATSDYKDLSNKPTINAVTVEGNKMAADYGLQDEIEDITASEIDEMIYGIR